MLVHGRCGTCHKMKDCHVFNNSPGAGICDECLVDVIKEKKP